MSGHNKRKENLAFAKVRFHRFITTLRRCFEAETYRDLMRRGRAYSKSNQLETVITVFFVAGTIHYLRDDWGKGLSFAVLVLFVHRLLPYRAPLLAFVEDRFLDIFNKVPQYIPPLVALFLFIVGLNHAFGWQLEPFQQAGKEIGLKEEHERVDITDLYEMSLSCEQKNKQNKIRRAILRNRIFTLELDGKGEEAAKLRAVHDNIPIEECEADQ